MREPTHVSYGELVRSMTECVRMLGYPFGQADDSAPGLVWTAAVLGKTFDLLRLADKRTPPAGWPRHIVSHQGARSVVDLKGAPLFALAARLADLARLNLGRSPDQIGSLLVKDTFGGWIAPYVTQAAASANSMAISIWSPHNTKSDEEAPPMLCACAPSGKADSHLLCMAPASRSIASEPPLKPYHLSSRATADVLQCFREGLRQPSPFFSIVVLPSECGSHIALSRSVLDQLKVPGLPVSTMGIVDSALQVRNAIKHGVQANSADLRFF